MADDFTPFDDFTPADAPAAPDMTEAEFTAERQRSATQEPDFKRLSAATIPMLSFAASMLPGVGPAAGATIQAGGTAWNQVAGKEPFDLKQIAASGVIPLLAPLASQLITAGAKGVTKAIGKFVNPGATRTAGVEAAAENLKAPANAIDRAYSPRASTGAFNVVRSTADDVPTPRINRAIMDALHDLPRANRPKAAEQYLVNLHDDFSTQTALPYSDIHKQISGMYQRAKDLIATGESESGHALLNARVKIIDELDKISPALKAANAKYGREQAIDRVAKVLSNPRPDVKLAQMLQEDPLTRRFIPMADARMLEKIAKQIATMGTQASPYSGVGAKTLNLIAAPLAAAMGSKTGMTMLRKTFQDGKVTPEKLAVMAQFMRAYTAQGGEQEQSE